jgi:putative membrane protein
VPVQFANPAARAAFATAITTIEQQSACEAVVAIRRQSASYTHVHAVVGALALFAALAFALYAEAMFSTLTILVEPFAVGLIAALAVEWLPAVKRLLTPRSMRQRAVERAARATFYERGVANTTGRTGILFYISWQEQLVAVIPDAAVQAALGPARIVSMTQTLCTAMSRGGVAVAECIAAFASELAVMPRLANDINEISDAIDTHLHRRDRSSSRSGAS